MSPNFKDKIEFQIENDQKHKQKKIQMQHF